MKTKTRLFFLTILSAVLASTIGPVMAGQDAAGIHRENKLLQEELALAKAPNFYFLFNLSEKSIALKSKGIVLRSWTAGKIRYWGKPVELRVLTLGKKTALAPPKRNVIKPGEPEEAPPTPVKPGEFELEALEVKDMPLSYTLELEDGTRIDVAPKKKGIPGLIQEFRWSVGLPLASLRKKAATTIGISFDDPKEGQALYWALTEGLKGLVWLPLD